MLIENGTDALKQFDAEAAKKPQYTKSISRAQRWKAPYRGDGALFA